MAKRNLGYSIVIICEGENTEPLYFGSIANKIKEEGLWGNYFNLTILPKPREEDNNDDLHPPKHKTSRKARYVKPAIEPILREVEEEYKTQPISFVRVAQLEMADGSYNEAWAVFDYDHRNFVHVKAAFDLADNHDEGIVSIAYSSVAFEHWYLLHFERNINAFNKSECRIGKDILECNSGMYPEDCYGARCIGGYLRHQGYITIDTKGNRSLFPALEDRLPQAYFNASWLRYSITKQNPGINYFELNPYVDVDKLVKYLLKNDVKYFWHEINTNITEFGDTFRVNLNYQNLSISVPDNSQRGIVLNEGDLVILGVDLNPIFQNTQREVVHVGDTTNIPINLEHHTASAFLRVRLHGNNFVCLEL
jgi:hypothetical protein